MMGLLAGGWLLSARADGPLMLTAEQGEYPLGLHLWLLEDPLGQLSIEQVSSPEFADEFTPSTQPIPNFGYSRSTHWARLELTHTLTQPQEWLLEVADPTLNSVTLYLPNPDDFTFTSKQTGDLYPRSTRDIDAPNFLFTLPLQPNQTQTFYLRIANVGSTPLPVTLWSPSAYAVKSTQMMFAYGFFYGFIFIMICYNLAIYSFLRETTYLFYVLTVAGLGAYFASLDGLASYYVWPNWLWWGNVSLLVFACLTIISGIGFSDRFLSIMSRAPALHRIAIWMQWLCAGLLLMSLVPAFYGLVGRGIAVATVIVCVSGVWLGITTLRSGFESARYYLLAWGALFVGAVLLVLSQFGLLPVNDLTANSMRFGIFFSVLFFSLALADRINLLRQEAERVSAQSKEAHNRFYQFLEAMPVGVCLVDSNLKTEFLNQRGREILAITQLTDTWPLCEELLNNGILKTAGSNNAFPGERLPYKRALQGENVYEPDIELNLPDRRVPLEMWAQPVFNDHGQISYAAVAFQDVSERRQVENELLAYRQNLEALIEQRTRELEDTNRQLEQDIQLRKQNEEQLRILSRAVEQSVNTIVITDLLGKIEYVNPVIFSTTGYSPQEIIGKKNKHFQIR
jgi:PAS domain-containing protein